MYFYNLPIYESAPSQPSEQLDLIWTMNIGCKVLNEIPFLWSNGGTHESKVSSCATFVRLCLNGICDIQHLQDVE